MYREGSHPIFSANNLIIEINSDRFSKAGLKIIKPDWKQQLKALPQTYAKIKTSDGYLVRDNNNVFVYLVEGKDIDFLKNTNTPCSLAGDFAGLSIETTSFKESVDFWQSLGFEISQGAIDQPWMVLENENKFSISFMKPLSCPHLFTNPSITFFNKDNNLKNISEIKAQGIPITEEITFSI